MPTTLHPKLRENIIKILEEALESSAYSIGGLDQDSIVPAIKKVQSALPTDTRELFVEAAGEDGLTALASDFIQRRYGKEMDEGFEGHLRELPGFDSSAMAEEFVALIESFPRTYCFSVRFPVALANSFKAHNRPAYVGSSVALVGSWNEEYKDYPRVEGTRTINYTSDDGQKSTHTMHSLHLHIRVDGIVQDGVHTDTPLTAFEIMRSFLGLCLASKALYNSDYAYGSHFDSVKIFDGVGRGATEISELNLPANDSELIRCLRVMRHAEGIAEVCEHLDGLHDSKNLTLAAKWYFESLSNPDGVMSFMQAAIVMEVLLGGGKDEQMGLTELLSNRCAYLLASSTTQRNLILEHFKKIYKTRSKIVHNGTSRLGSLEKDQLRLLRGLCARVLAKEALMHRASTQKAAAAMAGKK